MLVYRAIEATRLRKLNDIDVLTLKMGVGRSRLDMGWVCDPWIGWGWNRVGNIMDDHGLGWSGFWG